MLRVFGVFGVLYTCLLGGYRVCTGDKGSGFGALGCALLFCGCEPGLSSCCESGNGASLLRDPVRILMHPTE